MQAVALRIADPEVKRAQETAEFVRTVEANGEYVIIDILEPPPCARAVVVNVVVVEIERQAGVGFHIGNIGEGPVGNREIALVEFVIHPPVGADAHVQFVLLTRGFGIANIERQR